MAYRDLVGKLLDKGYTLDGWRINERWDFNWNSICDSIVVWIEVLDLLKLARLIHTLKDGEISGDPKISLSFLLEVA